MLKYLTVLKHLKWPYRLPDVETDEEIMLFSTQFRRSGQRDDRRRRFLADEQSGADVQTVSRRAGGLALSKKSEHYGNAEFMDEQLRLTDLIPRRPVTIAAVMLAGLSAVACLEILYTYTHGATLTTAQWRLATFDLGGNGSLAVWFSSALLLAAAVVAVVIYTVRRYKTDDYQGRYRIWLAAAACWAIMSIDATANLHNAFKELTTQATGTRLLGDGSIWWVVPCFFLFGAVGSRLVVDMHKCRLSTATLLAAGGCYILAVAAQLGLVLSDGGLRSVMLQSGAWLLGSLLLLMAMLLHGRYVILDAEGLLPNRDPDSEEEEENTAEEWMKIDSARQTPQPVLKRRTRQTASVSADSSDNRRLTKAEKKALRKRLMQQQMERQRSKNGAWK